MVQWNWQAGQIRTVSTHKDNGMQASGMTEHPRPGGRAFRLPDANDKMKMIRSKKRQRIAGNSLKNGRGGDGEARDWLVIAERCACLTMILCALNEGAESQD